MKRRAMVYRRRGRWLIVAEARTVDGFWITTPPFVDAGMDPADETLGRIVSCVVDLSIDGLETPPADENLFEPVLRWAGVKSHGVFMNGTQSVDVNEEWGSVTVTPMRNAGGRGGFVYIEDRGQILDSPSDEDLGRAVRSAFDRAE